MCNKSELCLCALYTKIDHAPAPRVKDWSSIKKIFSQGKLMSYKENFSNDEIKIFQNFNSFVHKLIFMISIPIRGLILKEWMPRLVCS